MNYIILFAVFVFQLTSLQAKELISTREDLDAAFVFLISKNTTWPNETQQKFFRIGIVDDNRAVLDAFEKLTDGLTLKEKKVVVKRLNMEDIGSSYQKYHVIFVGEKYRHDTGKILKSVPERYPLLVISKGAENEKNYMINLYEDQFNKINIQVNLEEIHRHRLTVSNEVILAGGKKVGISKLFESSLKALKKQEKNYKRYIEQNKRLQKETAKYKQNVATLKANMASLKKEIRSREEELKSKLEKIRKKDRELSGVLKLLKKEKSELLEKQEKLQELENEYAVLKKKLADQKALMDRQKNILKEKERIVSSKEREIRIMDERIRNQHRMIVNKTETIEQQGTILYLLIVIVALMLLFAIYFYRTKNKYKLLSNELALAKERADYANHSKSVFLANMSHELRTPLNAILGFSQLLSKDESLPEHNKKTIGSIYRAGRFLLSLIDDVLDLSRIEAGKLVLHEYPTDMELMLHDISAFVRTEAEKKGIRLLTEIDRNVPACIFADGDKLRQIILNYLTNAIKYSDGGEVRLSVKTSGNTLYIAVRDEGQGIREDEIADIFEPFVQVGSAGEHTGTGLGLTITRKYAQSMGGGVSVESRYGEGSTFRAEIRFGRCEHDGKEKRKELRTITGIKPARLIKILVVDDKEDNRELLRAILSQENCEVVSAENGEEAVALFEKLRPDIIWMDVKMPRMDGEEASRRIRKMPGGDKVVIVGITASVFKEDEEKLKESGIDSFILKPYDINAIYREISKYFDISYIYGDDEWKKEKTAGGFSHENFTARLERTDKEILKKLYDKTLLLDKDEIEKSITRDIADKDPSLADMLRYLVEEMQYDAIIKNISRILNR